MTEIEKSGSSSDVSSNSSWTFLEDADKSIVNVEKKNSESAVAAEQHQDACEINLAGSHVRVSVEAENHSPQIIEIDRKKDKAKEKVAVSKNDTETSKFEPFIIYNPLQIKNCIGTLTIIGTVLALTGLSFLCLLAPTTNPSFALVPNALENISNPSNIPPNYEFPVYESEDKSVIIDDPNSIIISQLKDMTTFAQSPNTNIESNNADGNDNSSEEKLSNTAAADSPQYPQTLYDFIKLKENSKHRKENNQIRTSAAKDGLQDKEIHKDSNTISEKGNNTEN